MDLEIAEIVSEVVVDSDDHGSASPKIDEELVERLIDDVVKRVLDRLRMNWEA